MRNTIFITLAFLCSMIGAIGEPRSLQAEERVDQSMVTVNQIFGKKEFEGQKWGPARWLKDGSGYTALEDSITIKNAKDIVRYSPKSGRRSVLVAAERLIPPSASKPLPIEGYAWSDDSNKALIFTNSKRVWRQNTRGDYWFYDRKTHRLQKLGGSAKPSTLMFATLSPDGNQVAYVCENNLYVQNLNDLKIVRLTKDGSETIINGTSDWVYEEEFDLRNAFRWSPDSKMIAYWQFDTAGVKTFQLVNNTDSFDQKITSYKYPKVGETNSACRVGIVECVGGDTRWLNTDADPRDNYIPEMEWTPNSRSVAFQLLNRLQNTVHIMNGDAKSGQTKTIFIDHDEAWIDLMKHWHWIDDGKRFLWLSERDGWRHVYAVSRMGSKVALLTPGEYDVISIVGIDEQQKLLYLIASPKEPTRQYLYSVPLDGSGKLTRVTPADQPGTHGYDMSPKCDFAVHTFSRFGQPPVVDLVSLPEHKSVRVLAENADLVAKLKKLKPCSNEFFRVDIGGGIQTDAWCIKPPDFDPAQKYPLLIFVYGEPAAQTVTDKWLGSFYLWHCMLAQQGYIVMCFDNHGTPTPRGRLWRKSVYRQIGILASADQAAATRQVIKERPYIDPKRIGIWGWSGGGSMTLNAIFRYPDLYRTGMAIAFISDQRLYDTVYQERYMGLPDDNKEGFKNGSPITFAHQLQGNLLLVHGTADDNCHYQNCELLVNELIKQNKQFSMMSYPNRTHAIREGPNTERHLFETLTRFLNEHMPAGPAK